MALQDCRTSERDQDHAQSWWSNEKITPSPDEATKNSNVIWNDHKLRHQPRADRQQQPGDKSKSWINSSLFNYLYAMLSTLHDPTMSPEKFADNYTLMEIQPSEKALNLIC